MAMDLIEKNISAENIPIKKNNLFVIYIREKNIKRRNLQIPGLIEAFSRATNHYYEK
jgi:hypothetical protein